MFSARKRGLLAVCLISTLQCGADAEPVSDATPGRLAAVVAAEHRLDSDRRRDGFRHPVETLLFFGIRDDMTAVELGRSRAGTATFWPRAAFRALKPGGVLGIVEHLAKPGWQDPAARSGYVTEEFVVELAASAGFRLMGASEVNANPKDTKDYPKGVWTLPPSYALGNINRSKYEAIGESDRMTLKFIKPAR